jgi:membrane associated rhomboid family serine protease
MADSIPTDVSPIPQRLRRALNISLGFIALLFAVFYLQQQNDFHALSLQPQQWFGLIGVISAPLLHGSFEHLFSNSFSILILGSLVGTVYPKAGLRALPVIWLLSGMGTWLIAMKGFHIGASGVTHGLMFFLITMGVLRRDRPAIAAAFIAILLFGGMLLSVLPQQPNISWEYHLSGAIAGVLSALLWHKRDPAPSRPTYSWETEEENDDDLLDEQHQEQQDTFELPRPNDVPVLWHRPALREEPVVLIFRHSKKDESTGSKHS